MTSDNEEAVRRANQVLPQVMNRFGRVAITERNGRVVSFGTATFVQIDGCKFVVTARHVISGFQTRHKIASLFCFDIPDGFSIPRSYRIRLDDSRIMDLGEGLDVVLLPAPPEVLDDSRLGWFDGPAQQPALTLLRREYSNNLPYPFLTMIVGFPHFSTEEDSPTRIQVAGSFACWAYLRQFVDPPQLVGRAVPQIILELDVPGQNSLLAQVPPIVSRFVANISHLERAGLSALGGYSGAPVFYIAPGDYFLIGIIKEGDISAGARMFATPTDAIVRSVRTMGRP